MKNFIFIVLFTLLSSTSFAKVAIVKILKGDVKVIAATKESPLKLDDWVEEGMVIKTSEKSFVKLVFVDKSSMNIGPSTQIKIEKFNGKEASVFDVVKGQIRSNVSKDYLQNPDKDKSKLFIKTKNAVLGVRGTDFLVTTNGINTSTVLFEGEIVFNSLPKGIDTNRLEDVVSQGVRIKPGEFSVVKEDLPQPTVPSTLNLKQREVLEKNESFESSQRGPASNEDKKPETKSVVPEGLNGEIVSNSSDSLKTEVAKNAPEAPAAPAPTANNPSSDAGGYVDGDKVKPANGSFVHLDSGTIIPPPADSVLDPNTNTFIPTSNNGTVADDGSFVPPAGVEITKEGKILISITTPNAEAPAKIIEVQQMAPVVSKESTSLATVVNVIRNEPILQNTTTPIQLAQVNIVNPAQTTQQILPPPNLNFTSPAQTNYTTSAPTETQIINQTTRGVLNINVIGR